MKSHGGATLKQNAIEHSFQVREKENAHYKKLVAQKALELIPDNSSIVIGTGSTTLELAILLSMKSGYKILLIHYQLQVLLISSKIKYFFLVENYVNLVLQYLEVGPFLKLIKFK